MRAPVPGGIEIRGYFPGAAGRIVEAHAVTYHDEWGLDATFEAQVARELSEFVSGFDETRDALWLATAGERFAGSIAIDGRLAATEGARLRWFLVAPGARGAGIGRALMGRAIEFCEAKGYARVFLWTFRGLDAARRLYERERFRLSAEHEVVQWGRALTEQRFELSLDPQDRRDHPIR